MKKALFALLFLPFLTLTACQTDIESEKQSLADLTDKPSVEHSPDHISIFSINDFHGKLLQDDDYPGLLSLEASIKSNPYYDPETSIIVSAGDMWQGGYQSGYDKGYTAAGIFNDLPLQVMELGNHEFDWGVDQIQKNEENADYPFVCANLVNESTGTRPDWLDAYAIVETGGVNIGFVGAIGGYLENDIKASALEGYHFDENVQVVSDAIDDCFNAGADFVFILLHDGKNSIYTSNLAIEAQKKNVTGIFGGHTHSFDNDDISGLPYVQGGSDSKGYSMMTLNTRTGRIEYQRYEYADGLESTNEALAKDIQDLVDKIGNPVYAQITGDWDKQSSANFVLKAMEHAVKVIYPDQDMNVLVAVHNTGGIRASYPSYATPHDFTMTDIQKVSPFDNTLVYIQDRPFNSGSISYHYSDCSGYLTDGDLCDVVTIDYLTSGTSSGLFAEEGSINLQDPIRGGDYIIYNAIADYASYLNSQGTVINSADY